MSGFEALAIGLGTASAAIGIAGNVQQNQAIDEQNRRNAENASRVSASNAELARQEAIDRRNQLARQADAYSGAIRTSSAERGTLGSPNQSALNRALSAWTAREGNRINTNLSATLNAIAANSTPEFIPRGSTAIGAFGAGLSGFQTGLSIYSAGLSNEIASKQLKNLT